ncbi:ATP-dependent nuclease [Fusibacter bizertensis]
MKLVNFSITNYRSITKANKIPVGDITILIGKNNEGKSNILKALQVAMSAIGEHSKFRIKSREYIIRSHRNSIYNWERDFPVEYQDRVGRALGTKSIFLLEFQLSEQEVIEFVDKLGLNVNGSIPIRITYGSDSKSEVSVVKQGKGAKSFNDKSKQITEFIATKLQLNYIEAVRTESRAYEIIRSLVSDELRIIEDNKDYIEAIETINRLQQEKLNIIAKQVEEPLKVFLPNIQAVEMKIQNEARSISLRNNFDIIINDGNPTGIESKGEGIKSLVTLALLKDSKNFDGASIVAIEEPESHLHPEAIDQLEKVLNSISQDHQVFITTHNPIFVNRENMKSNIIIDNGKAKIAKNIKEIRDILGIKASDNLINAKYVLIVEGEDDKIALNSILRFKSDKLKKAIDNKLLIIDTLGGAANLTYKISFHRSSLCQYHVMLDNDDEGRKAWDKANVEGILDINNVTMTICNGMKNAEFEDCIDVNVYKTQLEKEYNIDLSKGFSSNKKWSDRLMNSFYCNSKPFDAEIKKNVKLFVANCISKSPKDAICMHKGSPIENLIVSLETMIK